MINALGQPAPETVQAGFGCPVNQVGPAGPDRGDGRQHHDRAVALGPHPAGAGQQGGDVAGEVGADQRGSAAGVLVQLRLRDQHPGRGDDQIHRAIAERRADEGLMGRELQCVVAEHLHLVRQRPRGPGQRGRVAPGQQHLGFNGRRQGGQDGQPDLAGPAEQQHPSGQHRPSRRPRSEQNTPRGSSRSRASCHGPSERYMAANVSGRSLASLTR